MTIIAAVFIVKCLVKKNHDSMNVKMYQYINCKSFHMETQTCL